MKARNHRQQFLENQENSHLPASSSSGVKPTPGGLKTPGLKSSQRVLGAKDGNTGIKKDRVIRHAPKTSQKPLALTLEERIRRDQDRDMEWGYPGGNEYEEPYVPPVDLPDFEKKSLSQMLDEVELGGFASDSSSDDWLRKEEDTCRVFHVEIEAHAPFESVSASGAAGSVKRRPGVNTQTESARSALSTKTSNVPPAPSTRIGNARAPLTTKPTNIRPPPTKPFSGRSAPPQKPRWNAPTLSSRARLTPPDADALPPLSKVKMADPYASFRFNV